MWGDRWERQRGRAIRPPLGSQALQTMAPIAHEVEMLSDLHLDQRGSCHSIGWRFRVVSFVADGIGRALAWKPARTTRRTPRRRSCTSSDVLKKADHRFFTR